MALMEECWVVIDTSGDVVAQAEAHEDAVEWALSDGYGPVIDEIEDPGHPPPGVVAQLTANPGRPQSPTADLAQRVIPNAHATLAEVEAMDFQQAYEVIYPYYPRIRSAGATHLVVQDDIGKLCRAFLNANFKTRKAVRRGRPATIKGLSLAPALRWLDTVRMLRKQGELRVGGEAHVPPDKKWMRRFLELTSDLPLPTPREQGQYDHCVGASNYCRRCCLTGTGHGTTPHNVIKKVVLSTLLHQHPVEFFSMLREAIRRHARSAVRRGKEPMVRLNVFSDLPWEVMAPWIFDPRNYDGERVQFYDYTKLVGRGPQASEFGNYDMTFSFAGDNQHDVWDELQRGTRIAVVFAGNAMPRIGGSILWSDPGASSDTGVRLKVVDGLADDARPRDPPHRSDEDPCVVALKYKIPAGKPVASAFIVRAWKHPEGYYLCDAHLPGQTNLESEED